MKKNLYIFSSGELKREKDTICLIYDKEMKKKFIPVKDVSSISVFGEVTLNKRFLEFVAQNEVTLHFFNYYGFYVGSFYPRSHYNSGLIALKQCEHYLDKSKRMFLARKFVEGGLKNMLRNVKYYNNRRGGLDDYIRVLEEQLGKLENANTIEELMGIEGNARESYYLSFNNIINDDAYTYKGRKRRPPRTKLDALLSFGNSLLYATILGEIYKTHLDPRLGFLHAVDYRKFSLSLDIAEIFKPVIVDRLVLRLINKRMLDASSFAKELNGIYLSENGRRIFVEQYEKKLKQTITLVKRKVSYQMLIRLELYKLEKHLLGETTYQPFVMQ